MKSTSKVALGGMLTALTVTVMMTTGILPFMTYALPAVAGFMVAVAVLELNDKWAWMIFASVSLICLFLVPDKEAAVIYVFFFGWYPIIKRRLESKLPRFWEVPIKLIIFNAAMIAAYSVIINVFGIPLDESGELGQYAAVILLALGNVVFVCYDIALSKLIIAYVKLWQPRVRKLFKHH